MKLIQTYANNASVDIKHKPSIVEKFFPLAGIDKYITLQTKSGMPAKDYSYFQEAINLIAPILNKENIKILHLGQDSPPLNNTINLNGQTSIAQAAYILRRSQLHLGADSWMAHFCGAEDIPLVSLYGNTTVANHSPYFYNKDKTIFLESHRNGQKASFAREENPKTVDFINPEDVAKSVLQLLNLPFAYEFKTVEIGSQYNNRIIESLPNQVVDIRNLGIGNLIVRADYYFNEENIFNQLQACKCVIVTSQPINPQLLQATRPNILEIIYHIKAEPAFNSEFPKLLHDMKIPFKMFSYLPEEKINPYKLSVLDYGNGLIFKKSAMTPAKLDLNNPEKYFIKSNRFILSEQKVFASYYHLKNNLPLPGLVSVPQQLVRENIEYLGVDGEYNYYLEKV